eukprot:766725-Hanusia_phi.AAC.3
MPKDNHFQTFASSSLFEEALEYMEQSVLVPRSSCIAMNPPSRSCSSGSESSIASTLISTSMERDMISALLELSENCKTSSSEPSSAQPREVMKPNFLPWSLVALMSPGDHHLISGHLHFSAMENRTRSPETSDDSSYHLLNSPMYQHAGQDPRNVAGSKPRDLSKAKRKHHSQESVAVLQEWLFANMSKPFPTNYEKKELAIRSGLSQAQIVHWFNNARKRICRVLKSN